MDRSALVDAVRVRIDEVASKARVLVDVGVEEFNPTDAMIDGFLDESALEVLLVAPVIRLPMKDGKGGSIEYYNSDTKVGTIPLPSDFLRMVCIQMSDWELPLYDIQLAGSVVANRQKNKYLRGGAKKPAAVLEKRPSGYVLTYFSTNVLPHSIKRLDYIPVLPAEEVTGLQNIDALCWVCASKVLSVSQDSNAAVAAMERAKSLLK